MTKLALITIPLAAGLAWIAIAEVISGDKWLATITFGAALYAFVAPFLPLEAPKHPGDSPVADVPLSPTTGCVGDTTDMAA